MYKNSVLNFISPEAWLKNFKYPLLISGPCSAESEEQILNTAKALEKNKHIRIFRAGIWKPRTRPHSFQGIGENALKWLQNVKRETSLLLAVEVASPQHVEACLKHHIDVLWIGARTTVNPFYVQNIVDALKGTDIPVLVKNPINPDLDLWVGAIERLYKAGLRKIIAVHRGFNTYNKTAYRNDPIWDIPIELKRLFPSLAVICDPSHIAGKHEFLQEISQKAFNLGMCGLMIETHLTPSKAITDARQQITPDRLNEILNNLTYRKETGDADSQKYLELLRNQIDVFDIELLNLLKKRMDVVSKIGQFKKKKNITVYQVKRWDVIIKERTELAKKLGLSNDFITKILRLVHDESILLQDTIMRNK